MPSVKRESSLDKIDVPSTPVLTRRLVGPVELTVVLPTFNERGNVEPLIARLEEVLAGIEWEAIFVDDDSQDGTAEHVRAVGRRKPYIRCLQRLGRRGLSTACIEGVLASSSPFIAVMDADLQHDETQLPKMVGLLQRGEAELVVGSRYIEGGSADSFDKGRAGVSVLATEVAKRVLGVKIADPMSGFFMIRRAAAEEIAPALSSQGFKLLLDMVATSRGTLRVAELPYVFRERQHGESKLDARVVLDLLALIVAKLSNDAVSFRFLMFCFVGLTGVFIHMAALAVALDLGALTFGPAQTLATVIAIAWNFVLNNALTYRDQRLSGWAFVTGLLRFQVICAVGAISNVGVANWLYGYDPEEWWIAGLGGALMGAVWNYVVSAAFVWRTR